MSEIQIDFNNYKRIAKTFLKITALNREAKEDSKSSRDKWRVIVKDCWFIFCYINIVTFYIYTYISMTFRAQKDPKIFFHLISTASASTAAFIRVFYSFITKSKIGEISAMLGKSYTKQQAEYYGFAAYANFYRRIMNVYLSNIFITIILFVLSPFLTLIMTGERTFGSLSPFDERASAIEIYPFALFWTFWSFSLLIFSIAGAELTMYTAIMTNIIEFEILRQDFEDLKFYKKLKLTNEVRSLIHRHNKLFDNVQQLEETYSFPMFSNFYSTAFMICFTALQASTSNDPGELIGMAFFCISGLFNLFMQSYFGDLLKSVSESVVLGVYECEWEYMSDMNVRRELPFIIKRAQIPAKLTCMNIADVSLYQFANVVSYSYSFFTLCRRIYFKL